MIYVHLLNSHFLNLVQKYKSYTIVYLNLNVTPKIAREN